LTDVTTDTVITKAETFGPIAPLYRFKTDADDGKRHQPIRLEIRHRGIPQKSNTSAWAASTDGFRVLRQG
jgi:hypothetical protein